jgi:TolB-like protein
MSETTSLPPETRTIEAQLQRILEAPSFRRSAAVSALLRCMVSKALAGEDEDLKEYALGLNVFERGKDFDPRIDPIVRVQARNLRSKLDEYYLSGGAEDLIRIEIPKGSYVPIFRPNEPPPAASPEGPEPGEPETFSEARRTQSNSRLWAGVLLVVVLAAVVGAFFGFRAGERTGADQARNTFPLTIASFESSTNGPETPLLASAVEREFARALEKNRAIALLPAGTVNSFRLGGMVACYGDHVIVKAQLYRGKRRIWSGTYDRLADTPDAIARGVVAEIQPRLLSMFAAHWNSE